MRRDVFANLPRTCASCVPANQAYTGALFSAFIHHILAALKQHLVGVHDTEELGVDVARLDVMFCTFGCCALDGVFYPVSRVPQHIDIEVSATHLSR